MAPADVCVTTRHAWRAQMEQEQRDPSASSSFLSVDSPYVTSTPSSPLTTAVDSSSDDDFWPPSPKRPRTQSATAGPSKQRSRKTKCARSSNVTRDHTPASMTATASASSSRAASRHRSTTLEAPIYRTSRSRSASAFRTPPEMEENPDWVWWTDEDGSPGPDFVSAASVVERLIKSYKSYFKNPDDPDDKSFEVDALPCSDLEYPNNNACERFILLAPKDPDHYNPIMCLESSLYTIIDCMWFGYTVRIANELAQGYLTPAQKALFGTLPTGFLSDHTPPPSPSPPTSPPAADPFEDVARPHDNQEKPTRTNHLRTLQRAIRRRDGPLFLQTMDAINYLLRYLKYPPLPDDVFASPLPNELMTHIRANWAQSSPRGIPRRVLLRIVEETYQRTVGPNVGQLSRYSAFSSEVYGELMPSFTTNVISQTGLRTGSLLVDLGSGVGNVLVQASLSTGCSAFGVEIMAGPAALARSQLQQIRTRCRMWGLRIGDVELVEADMLSNSRVDELLPKADVVLVNNKVFQESLNTALRPKFLDLKEGAIVVSLKPFVQPNARVTERNVDDICAIFDVEEKSYRSGDVSWGSGGGSYYLHRVDRVGYANIRERFENSRAKSVRAGRR